MPVLFLTREAGNIRCSFSDRYCLQYASGSWHPKLFEAFKIVLPPKQATKKSPSFVSLLSNTSSDPKIRDGAIALATHIKSLSIEIADSEMMQEDDAGGRRLKRW
jgi:hypothetical protein